MKKMLILVVLVSGCSIPLKKPKFPNFARDYWEERNPGCWEASSCSDFLSLY